MNSLLQLDEEIDALERKIQLFEDTVPNYLTDKEKFACYSALNRQLATFLEERQSTVAVLLQQQSQGKHHLFSCAGYVIFILILFLVVPSSNHFCKGHSTSGSINFLQDDIDASQWQPYHLEWTQGI
jgi:hypothetical protein